MIGIPEDDSKLDNPYSNTSSSAPLLPALQGHRVSENPPPFQESNPSRVLQFDQEDTNWIQGGEEPPPEFTPYEAQHWVNADGDIVSHDPHLNEDGEALYRFLLSQSMEPPSFRIRMRGTHKETRTRLVTHAGHTRQGNDGSTQFHGSHTKTETYTEVVTDFDFQIDITHYLLSAAYWTVQDIEPAYRGKMIKEKDIQDGISLNRKRTKRKERKAADKWRKFKEENGYPPWAQTENFDTAIPMSERNGIRSSRTVRDWADEYCASDKLLKEFVFEKVVHGWNIETLRQAVDSLIKSTYYTGNIEVTFPISGNKIYVRPTNQLARALSHWWIKLLLWITLIYPFIWLYKRFAPRGGGIWRVAGAAYPLKEWVHLEDSIRGEDVAQYATRKEESLARTQYQRQLQVLPSTFTGDRKTPIASSSTSGDAWADQRPQTLAQFGNAPTPQASTSGSGLKLSKLRQTPNGISELVGLREGEWFKQWEGTITRAVLLRVDRRDPISIPGEFGAASAGAMLDGFND